VSISSAVASLRSAPHAHTEHLVVIRRGVPVAEESLGVRRPDEPADVFSVTKSVLGTLVLSAVREGRIGLDTTLGEALGDRVPPPRRAVRIRHLLAMTGGAECGGPEAIDRVTALGGGWVRALLESPQAHPPGTRFQYDNGAAHLLAAAVTEAVGDLRAYAERIVFRPLGIERWHWPVDPDGIAWGFSGLRVSATDLARIGEAWRTDAFALGDLMRRATRPHTGGGAPEMRPYGWTFWTDTIAGHGVYYAAGWSGQVVLVVPDHLSVVVTGNPRFLTERSQRPYPVVRELAAAEISQDPCGTR